MGCGSNENFIVKAFAVLFWSVWCLIKLWIPVVMTSHDWCHCRGWREFSEAGSLGSTRWKKDISEASLASRDDGYFTGLVPCYGGSSLLMLPGYAVSLLKLFYLAALGLSCGIWTVSCGMWDLIPWPHIEPWPLHWESGVSATGPPGKCPLCGISWKGRWVAVPTEENTLPGKAPSTSPHQTCS